MNAPTHLPTLIDALPGEPADAPHGLFTRARQVEFLHALADCGAVRNASARVGVSYRTVYRERRANAAFRRAWDAALLSARALSEDVLACRALDGVEEVVWFRGEEVGRRVRYDSRLLLAHLARLDKLTEDARTRAFADDYEGALERYAAGIDDPAPVCAECGDALPLAPSAEPTADPERGEGDQQGERDGEAAPHAPGERISLSPGLCDRCDSAARGAGQAPPEAPSLSPPPPAAVPHRCPACDDGCDHPDFVPCSAFCPCHDERVAAMYEAHPDGAPWPADFLEYDDAEVEGLQLWAFEAGVPEWWLIVDRTADGEWERRHPDD
jgi:hypothetical protein